MKYAVYLLACVTTLSCGKYVVPHKNCEIVSIPEQWRITDMLLTPIRPEVTAHADGGDVFELRTLQDDVLIAVRSAVAKDAFMDVVSRNKFKFTLQNPIVLLPLADHEWLSGKLVSASAKDPSGFEQHTSNISYRGKNFRFSGENLCPNNGVLPSNDGHWLAVQSEDTTYHANAFPTPPHGTLYVDVFDMKSGTRRFHVSAKVDHRAPGELAPQVRWISSSYLFIDVFEDKQKFILCNAAK